MKRKRERAGKRPFPTGFVLLGAGLLIMLVALLNGRASRRAPREETPEEPPAQTVGTEEEPGELPGQTAEDPQTTPGREKLSIYHTLFVRNNSGIAADFCDREANSRHGAVEEGTYFDGVTNSPILVYTPPDYDPEKAYDVLIVFHGDGNSPDQILRQEHGNLPPFSVILDNMIQGAGEMPPVCEELLVVAPGWNWGSGKLGNTAFLREDVQNAMEDMAENALRYTVEHYATYAKTLEEVPAVREHFGLCGISRGSVFVQCGGMARSGDKFAIYGFFSWGGTGGEDTRLAQMATLAMEEKGITPRFLLAACGDSDKDNYDNTLLAYTYYAENGLVRDGENGCFLSLTGGHRWSVWLACLYNMCLLMTLP